MEARLRAPPPPAVRVDYYDAAVEFIRVATAAQEDRLIRAFVENASMAPSIPLVPTS